MTLDAKLYPMSTSQVIRHFILKIVSQDTDNYFDSFIEECQTLYNGQAHCLADLKAQSTKAKGDLFEVFTLMYIEAILQWDSIWLLKDVPHSVLQELGMGSRDMGIDLVGYHDGQYIAVQCKYKKKNSYKNSTCVGWRELSTFQALCARTGPWKQQLVVTNCDYVRHQGKKSAQDWTIAKKTFQGLSRDQWLLIAGETGNKLADGGEIKPLSQDELRAKRLAFFS